MQTIAVLVSGVARPKFKRRQIHPSLPLPLLFLPFPLPLEVVPLNAARGLGSAVSSRSGVWGRAPAKIEFGAF